jgi:P-type Cu2+ transporter
MTTQNKSQPPATPDAKQPNPRPVACVHCGLPVPKGRIDPDAKDGLQFCCGGCEAVYAVIHKLGLQSYYNVRQRQDVDSQQAKTTGAGYQAFDHPEFVTRCCEDRPDGLRTTSFYLEGVHCAACLWLVEKLPTIVPGVTESRLHMGKSLVRLTWDPRQAELSRIAASLDSLGYPPHPARDVQADAIVTRENRRELIRIGVAGAAVGNAMILAVCLYAGYFTGIEKEYETLFRWVGMGIALVALAWPGAVFFRGAWSAIRTRTAHMDLPIAMGLTAGGLAGTVNTITGRGEVYFDTLAVLVFLLLVGRAIQRRQQRRAADAVEQLFRLTPVAARQVDDSGDLHEVPIEALKAGDIVELHAGESVPVDGAITRGKSEFDQSLLTGESRPVVVGNGGTVHAGSVNLSSTVRIRVEATGERTRVGALIHLIEQSAQSKAPAVQTADKLAGWFVAVVVVLAVLTFAFWLMRDPIHAADHAVALLIVACPCALGLATPLTLAVAIGRAAGRGVLIKGGVALERMADAGTILLDKTGTVTLGNTTLIHWHGDASIKPLVAAIESHSSHRIAKALVQGLGEPDEHLQAVDVTQTHDGGITGRVGDLTLAIGSCDFHKQGQTPFICPGWVDSHITELTAASLTPVLIAVDDEVRAVAGLGDAVRPDARQSIDALRNNGWRVGMVSGDHNEVVRHVADDLGITPDMTHGNVMPEQKVELVRRYGEQGPVVMVGDGVNDAAALASATVGIAVHGGAEASLAAADIYLAKPGLGQIIGLTYASRRVIRGIRRGLAVSLAYNAIGVTLAATGVINPLIAAILMPLSSLSVLSMAVSTRAFADHKAKP